MKIPSTPTSIGIRGKVLVTTGLHLASILRWRRRIQHAVFRRLIDQQNLFPMEDAPDGLLLEGEIITATEEAAFLNVINELPFGPFRMHGVAAKRHVIRFGAYYLAGSAEMKPTSEFPLSLEPLRARAAAAAGVPVHTLSESLVSEYPPGAGIGRNRDSPPFGIVVGISLGAVCRMRFQPG